VQNRSYCGNICSLSTDKKLTDTYLSAYLIAKLIRLKSAGEGQFCNSDVLLTVQSAQQTLFTLRSALISRELALISNCTCIA
jgi:hypothetical protein